MKIKSALLLFLFFGIAILPTCRRDVYSPDVCFQENILPIFISKCSMSGCHDSISHKKNYILTTYEGIMKGIKPHHPMLSKNWQQIYFNGMPPGNLHSLSSKEKTLIKTWILMGAPNNSNCKSCDTTSATYSKQINPLLAAWCTGCHNQGSAGGGFDLTNYSGVVTAIQNNKLLGSIKHLKGFIPMPQNSSALSACDIGTVQKWINEGYPNN